MESLQEILPRNFVLTQVRSYFAENPDETYLNLVARMPSPMSKSNYFRSLREARQIGPELWPQWRIALNMSRWTFWKAAMNFFDPEVPK